MPVRALSTAPEPQARRSPLASAIGGCGMRPDAPSTRLRRPGPRPSSVNGERRRSSPRSSSIRRDPDARRQLSSVEAIVEGIWSGPPLEGTARRIGAQHGLVRSTPHAVPPSKLARTPPAPGSPPVSVRYARPLPRSSSRCRDARWAQRTGQRPRSAARLRSGVPSACCSRDVPAGGHHRSTLT
jgi:hypothetical protein